ncbi:MAG: ArsR/SmtB family transcription factor [Acidimicrobiales bacterium]
MTPNDHRPAGNDGRLPISANADRQLMALANPTRRAVYDIIRARPSSVSAVASQLPVSQPAVSQHLRVLSRARLVTATPFGAQRIYKADPAGVKDLRTWIDGLWDDVLDSFVDAASPDPSSEEELVAAEPAEPGSTEENPE